MPNRRLSDHKIHRDEVVPIRRIAYTGLFFIAGILFPVLIWVALFIAVRRPLLQVARRVASLALALVGGVLFPVLIWVALFVTVREPLLQVAKRVAYTVLALLTGMVFPVLIWIGLVTAMRQWIQDRVPRQESPRTVGNILATAGITIQGEPIGGMAIAETMFARRSMTEIHELIARAGL